MSASAILHQMMPDLARVPTLLNAESRGTHERVCFRRSRWQVEVERCASSVVGCGPQSATMRFHDGTADRQPHAAALGFSGEESTEYLVRSSGRQSYSGVAD